MSNEYKDWLCEKVQDVLLERGLADKTFWPEGKYVEGIKNGQRVRFEVWFDNEMCEWRAERRETNI